MSMIIEKNNINILYDDCVTDYGSCLHFIYRNKNSCSIFERITEYNGPEEKEMIKIFNPLYDYLEIGYGKCVNSTYFILFDKNSELVESIYIKALHGQDFKKFGSGIIRVPEKIDSTVFRHYLSMKNILDFFVKSYSNGGGRGAVHYVFNAKSFNEIIKKITESIKELESDQELYRKVRIDTYPYLR